MIVRELIKLLTDLEAQTGGDIQVRFMGVLSEDSDDDDTIAVAGLAVEEDAEGQPATVLICDDLTLDAFLEDEGGSG